MFEPEGPPCPTGNCPGVLWPCVSLKPPRELWQQCTTCKQQFYRMPAEEAVGHAIRTIKRALAGEKEN